MRSARIAASGAALLLSLPLLAACAGGASPEEAAESLTEVTADAEPPNNAELYDAEIDPKPIVDPLSCSRYLVITARGTGEPSKKQLLTPTVKAIKSARPNEVQHLDLDYPADTEVKDGGTLGARTIVDTLNVQAEACPEQSFVLLGYSQGALVIGDALDTPEYRLVGLKVGEVDQKAADRILSIVFFGNPRFLGTEPYAVGTFNPQMNGLLPRPAEGLARYADRLRDYCSAKDVICQAEFTPELNEAGHVTYYKNGMPQDGAAFVITKLAPIDTATPEESAKQDSARDVVPPTEKPAD